jgi:hypothetical protein
MRSDAELDEVRIESEHFFRRKGSRTETLIAFEGLAFEVQPRVSGQRPRLSVLSSARPL